MRLELGSADGLVQISYPPLISKVLIKHLKTNLTAARREPKLPSSSGGVSRQRTAYPAPDRRATQSDFNNSLVLPVCVGKKKETKTQKKSEVLNFLCCQETEVPSRPRRLPQV